MYVCIIAICFIGGLTQSCPFSWPNDAAGRSAPWSVIDVGRENDYESDHGNDRGNDRENDRENDCGSDPAGDSRRGHGGHGSVTSLARVEGDRKGANNCYRVDVARGNVKARVRADDVHGEARGPARAVVRMMKMMPTMTRIGRQWALKGMDGKMVGGSDPFSSPLAQFRTSWVGAGLLPLRFLEGRASWKAERRLH